MKQRPLSPHLQIYRPQWTSVLSITHRATGMALSVGYLGLVAWLYSLSQGEECFKLFQHHIRMWYGQVCLWGWVFSLFYHLCNGIRHLVWDSGYGFNLKIAYRSGLTVVATALLMTLFVRGITW